MSTRERKLKFLSDCRLDIRTGVAKMILQYGEGWLTDDQIDDIVRDEIDNWKRARQAELRERANELSRTMQCNCDLDNWQPEPSTGHSCVCRIHKAAVGEQ